MKYLRRLMTILPQVRYLNWYGPTETNVCTSYEVSLLDPERTTPIPIGKACANTKVFAVNNVGEKVTEVGESGELYVRGPSLMQGYWGHPEKTAKVLMRNPFQSFDRGRSSVSCAKSRLPVPRLPGASKALPSSSKIRMRSCNRLTSSWPRSSLNSPSPSSG